MGLNDVPMNGGGLTELSLRFDMWDSERHRSPEDAYWQYTKRQPEKKRQGPNVVVVKCEGTRGLSALSYKIRIVDRPKLVKDRSTYGSR